ncbi:MAG: ankyrin repeat domain-containing protein [Deltaproteobacteria bacterium]|nr:ankyrin repeat domain-containing protein [Deltaproteobacteria bacterium]
MKSLIKFVLCICVFFPISAVADSWAPPERKEFFSPDNKVRFTVIPSRGFDEFEVGPVGLLEQKNEAGKYEFVWVNKLVNDTTPVSAIVSDSGNYILTIDDYLSAGYGDKTIVLYNKSGNKIANFELDDALSEEQIRNLPTSVSSIWWYCGSSVIDEAAERISIRIKPTRAGNKECGEIVIDLKLLKISYLEDAGVNSKMGNSNNVRTASPSSASFFPSNDDRIKEIRQGIQKEIFEAPEVIKLIRTFQFKSRTGEFSDNTSYLEQEKKLYDDIKKAIQSGVDCNKKDKQGKTALYYASGFEEIIFLLLENGADPTIDLDDWNNSFLNAVSHDRVKMVEAMVKAGASLEYIHKTNGHTPLTMAMTFYFSHKSNEMLKLLLQLGADPNKKSLFEYPLDAAIQSDNWEGVDILVKAGANKVNLKKENALFLSIHLKDIESLKMLLKERFETRPGDYVYERAIIQAASTGYDEGIKLLVDSGVSPDSKYDSTPLMVAAKKGRLATIETLIKLGADVNKTDDYGFSPLDVSLLFNHKECENLLRNNSAVAGVFTPSVLKFIKGDIERMKSTKENLKN